MELEQILIAAFAVGLVYVAYRDWTAFWIPDHATLPLAVLGIGWVAARQSDWRVHLAAAVIGGLVFVLIALSYRRLRGRDGLGMGDAKLVAVGGLWLGPTLAWAIAFGTGLAMLATLGLLARGLRTQSDPIPLGTYLSIGFLVGMFV